MREDLREQLHHFVDSLPLGVAGDNDTSRRAQAMTLLYALAQAVPGGSRRLDLGNLVWTVAEVGRDLDIRGEDAAAAVWHLGDADALWKVIDADGLERDAQSGHITRLKVANARISDDIFDLLVGDGGLRTELAAELIERCLPKHSQDWVAAELGFASVVASRQPVRAEQPSVRQPVLHEDAPPAPLTGSEAREPVGFSDDVGGKAIRLFQYLWQVQSARTKVVRRTQEYRRQGDVLWFGELPDEPEVKAAHAGAPAPDDPWLTLPRVHRATQPLLPEILEGWVTGSDELDRPPELREQRRRLARPDEAEGLDSGEREIVESLDERPDVRAAFAAWTEGWHQWAAEEARREPLRQTYKQLFRMGERVQGAPEDLEVLLGVGLLSWNPLDHPEVQRHLVTMPAEIHYNDADGSLQVRPHAGSEPELDLEMLNAERRPRLELREELAAQIAEAEHNLLDRGGAMELLTRVAYRLDADATATDTLTATPARDAAEVAFCPALVLRRRGTRDLLRIYEQIIEDLETSGDVPVGLAQLVEIPDEPPRGAQEPRDAARTDDEAWLPLEANNEQRQIVAQIDRADHTVVQGPPGTGKTHTLANVLAHLLAQGKRVLITAQTDRALRELRDKLPEELVALCVSVVGRDSADLADLRVAVNSLASTAENFNAPQQARRGKELAQQLDVLRRERSRLHSRLVALREWETLEVDVAGRRGTPAQLAQLHQAEAAERKWILDVVSKPTDEAAPLSNDEVQALLALLRDPAFGDELEARECEVDLGAVPTPTTFDGIVGDHHTATKRAAEFDGASAHPAWQAFYRLDAQTRNEVKARLNALANEAVRLARRGEPWLDDALHDAVHGRVKIWRQRLQRTESLLAEVTELDSAAKTARVEAPDGRLDDLAWQADDLIEHLQGGGKLRGGLLAAKPVRAARELLEEVRLDGRHIDGLDSCRRFRDWVKLRRVLEDAERVWASLSSLPEGSMGHRLAWFADEAAALNEVLSMADGVAATERRLDDLEVPHPPWTSLEEVRGYNEVIDAVEAEQRAAEARARIGEIQKYVHSCYRGDGRSSTSDLREAVRQLDGESYAKTYERIARFPEILRAAERRDALLEALGQASASLANLAHEAADESSVEQRLLSLEEAWRWLRFDTWLRDHDPASAQRMQDELDETERRIRSTVTKLSALHAWTSAVQRLGQRERSALKAYALAVKSLGKGTGKYAPRRRAEARDALRRCRSAVPAWVMPLYRIADTIDIARDAFDVVMIDEASQAGVEASFLHYLAPKMLVVGDDKQVSPAGVGIDQEDLRRLSKDYLFGVEHQATWNDPRISLFDQARVRYGEVITLREHFRCMPEIIGFSNRIAYEPDGVPLIPLRQYGVDRLEPIKTVHCEDGYTEGRRGNVNPPEVDAVVEIVAKCIADPAYDGKTLGVISLTGNDQAHAIENRLLDELDPAEITARDLRCGDAADFQGSERDVIVLSMVAAPEPGRSLNALSGDAYAQRFNVAASRARDQMWLVHSARLQDFSNREGMRYQLLDYCLRTSGASNVELAVPEEVPEDIRVDPFDSLFEQQVFNRIRRRGYVVVAQHPVHDHRIDLVVVGGKARLAVECDGDYWHGPDRYEADLDRQRTLERCGWEFVRIRGSAFYRDPDTALEPVWERLNDLGILSSLEEAERRALAAESSSAVTDRAESPDGRPVATEEGVGGEWTPRQETHVSNLRGHSPVEHPGSGDAAGAARVADDQERADPVPAVLAEAADGDGRARTTPDQAAVGGADLGLAGEVDSKSSPRTRSSNGEETGGTRQRGGDEESAAAPTPLRRRFTPEADEERERAAGSAPSGSVARPEVTSPPRATQHAHAEAEGLRRESWRDTERDVVDGAVPQEAVGEAQSALHLSGIRLQPYGTWSERMPAPDPGSASRQQLIDGLRRIVDVEGPVVAKRVYGLIVRSAGGNRVGSAQARKLNSAVTAAVSKGVIRAADPLGQGGSEPLTLFKPNTPNTVVRELGPRTLYEVPPGELVAVLSQVYERGMDSDDWFRRVLDLYGLKRLTQPAKDRFQACARLLDPDVFPGVSGLDRRVVRLSDEL